MAQLVEPNEILSSMPSNEKKTNLKNDLGLEVSLKT